MLKIWNGYLLIATALGSVACQKAPDAAPEPQASESDADPLRIVVSIMDYPTVPDLSSNPYEDAFATARVMPRETLGQSFDEGPFTLLFRVLNDRKRLSAADFQPGDLLSVTLTAQDAVSDGLRSIQVL
jgi:hypothetical protein